MEKGSGCEVQSGCAINSAMEIIKNKIRSTCKECSIGNNTV